MNTLILFGVVAVTSIMLLVIIGITISKLYVKATKETAFVRTGLSGERVIKDGGAIVIGAFHEIAQVNMKTVRLVVRRDCEQALITADKLRVDVEAEFHVRVKQDADAISKAAQTLGDKTMNPQLLKEQVESKFVDALRAVAAGMAMNQLHENRAEFVQQVQNTLNEDLEKNGLELETVSLTALDQTEVQFFNEANAFDAEGLKKLKEITELRKKERNEIERDTQIQIEQKDLETKQKSLRLKKDEEFAIAEQLREVAEKQASENKTAELARIAADRETREAEIEKEKAIEQANIARDKAIKEAQIAQTKALEAAEIEKKKAVEAAEIEKKKAVELAELDKQVQIAQKSEEQSKAKADAELARAEAVKAEQDVLTAEAVAKANREKEIKVIAKRAEAEQDAASILVTAEAERRAAEDKAAAKLVEAKAKRESIEIEADGESHRLTVIAEAKAKDYTTEADGIAAKNAAANNLPQAERELAAKIKLIENLPAILEAMAKPIGEIDSIRVLDMRGNPLLPGFTTSDDGVSVSTTPNGGLPAQVIDSLMKYRTQMPLLDQLLREVNIDLSKGLSSATDGLLEPKK